MGDKMMLIEKTKEGIKNYSAKEIKYKYFKHLNSHLAKRILNELAIKPDYPKNIAKKLKVHEQKVYYHIRNLEKAGIVEHIRTDVTKGASANIFKLCEPVIVLKFSDVKPTGQMPAIKDISEEFFYPLIDNGRLNATVVVGSPDPHGPEKARSRDGYYGIDLALFIGTFLNQMDDRKVKLDTEVNEDELRGNLVLIGGPVVNNITRQINHKLQIFFDEKNHWAVTSKVSGKSYHADEIGVIVKWRNPFNPKKFVLLVAGKRYAGTKAAIIGMIKHYGEVLKGNKHNPKILAKIFEGIDLDSDGIVDDVEVIE